MPRALTMCCCKFDWSLLSYGMLKMPCHVLFCPKESHCIYCWHFRRTTCTWPAVRENGVWQSITRIAFWRAWTRTKCFVPISMVTLQTVASKICWLNLTRTRSLMIPRQHQLLLRMVPARCLHESQWHLRPLCCSLD